MLMDAEKPLTQRWIRERSATITNTLRKLVREDGVKLTPGGGYRPVAVVEHMEFCGIRSVQKGPASPYGTLGPRPESRPGDAADEGDTGNGWPATPARWQAVRPDATDRAGTRPGRRRG